MLIVRRRRLHELPAFPHIVRDGLFHIDILAGLDGPDGGERVPVIRRGDRNGIDLFALQQLANVGVALHFDGPFSSAAPPPSPAPRNPHRKAPRCAPLSVWNRRRCDLPRARGSRPRRCGCLHLPPPQAARRRAGRLRAAAESAVRWRKERRVNISWGGNRWKR